MEKKIIIIGSGIAGLTFANFIKKNSKYKFIIYEKNDSINLDEGYGIQLSVNSSSILNELGLSNLGHEEKYNPSKLDFYNKNNKKICELDLTTFNKEKDKYTTIKRSNLIKFLRSELFTNSIVFGKKLKNIEKSKEKLKLQFEDNSVDEADYLIVSDGIFSNTKSIIEQKKIDPNYFGAVAVRAIVKQKFIKNINANNISLIMGPNYHIVIYPVGHKKEMNLVCIIRNKSNNKNVDHVTLLNETVLKDNIELRFLLKENLKSWRIYISDKPVMPKYKNIFYVGDAFYSFPPTMAQGASQSIEAAEELYKKLKDNEKNFEIGYFKNRLKRTNQIKIRSYLNYTIFHFSNPVLIYLRNLAIKFLINNKFLREFYLGKVFRK